MKSLLKVNDVNRTGIILFLIGMIIGSFLTLVRANICAPMPTSTVTSNETNKGFFTIDTNGNTISSDGVIRAEFNKEEGILTLSGHGTVTKDWDWVQAENRKYVRTIIFQNSILSIGIHAFSRFREYDNLESIIFEGDINIIGECAFSANFNLKEVEFQGDCHRIGDLAFYECYSLEKINIPEGCSIHWTAFNNTPFEATKSSEG